MEQFSSIKLQKKFTDDDLKEIKDIIPKINSFVLSYINNHKNTLFKKKKVTDTNSLTFNEDILFEQILDKAKSSFKKENIALLSKSISYAIKDISPKFQKYKKLSDNSTKDKFTKDKIYINTNSNTKRKSCQKLSSEKKLMMNPLKIKNKFYKIFIFSPSDKNDNDLMKKKLNKQLFYSERRKTIFEENSFQNKLKRNTINNNSTRECDLSATVKNVNIFDLSEEGKLPMKLIKTAYTKKDKTRHSVVNYIKIIEKLNSNNALNKTDEREEMTKCKKSKLNNKKGKRFSVTNTKIDINHIMNLHIDEQNFNIFEFKEKVGRENTLLFIGNFILKKLSLTKVINFDKFSNWCKKIAEGYIKTNPYHNDIHGADVAQTCLLYIKYGRIDDMVKLSDISKCSIFLSCLCHDYKHPGVNNDFLKATNNDLAIRYNDISILENMHISETFNLINKNKECNIFASIDSNVYKKMRKEMISCVLATDIAVHSQHVNFMKKIIEQKDKKNDNMDNVDFMKILVHSADISNPTKVFDVYFEWSKLVVEEFCLQGDKEKELGIKCNFDRKTMKLSTSQIGFIDNVVEPYFSLFTKIFPNLKFFYDNMKNNRERFTKLDKEKINDKHSSKK